MSRCTPRPELSEKLQQAEPGLLRQLLEQHTKNASANGTVAAAS